MSSSWPVGVTTQEDMERYATTLFGNCRMENLLAGTPFDGCSECILIRVKGACNQVNWDMWPKLIEDAMQDTVATYGRLDIIQAKTKVKGAPSGTPVWHAAGDPERMHLPSILRQRQAS